jgi:hypothetical protein
MIISSSNHFAIILIYRRGVVVIAGVVTVFEIPGRRRKEKTEKPNEICIKFRVFCFICSSLTQHLRRFCQTGRFIAMLASIR